MKRTHALLKFSVFSGVIGGLATGCSPSDNSSDAPQPPTAQGGSSTNNGSNSFGNVGNGGRASGSAGSSYTGSGNGSGWSYGSAGKTGAGKSEMGAAGAAGAAGSAGTGDGGSSGEAGNDGLAGDSSVANAGNVNSGGGAANSGGGAANSGGGAANSGGGAPIDGIGGSSPDPIVRGPDPTLDSTTKLGPCAVRTLSAGLRDGSEYGTQTLYYPGGSDSPYAGVVIVPGFQQAESAIQAWGPFLASYCIATLTIGANSLGDSPDQRASALMDGIETLKAENTRAASPLRGKLALDRLGVMGASMGGAGALIAASAHPELKVAVAFAAWSPGTSFAKDQVPTLLFAGSADLIAGGQAQAFYGSIPATTPKMVFEIAGGDSSVSNNPQSASGEVGRYGLSWLKVFLEGDQRYRQFLLQKPNTSSDFQVDL